MNGKKTSWLLALGVALAALPATVADAAPPWDKLLTFNRVEADPDKAYRLTEENGPWLITACSFSGEGAERQARDLVHELRRRYKMPAYTHKMRFDFGEEDSGRGVDRFGEPLKMRYRRGSELEEIAVLVGDYPAVDDPQAQKTLHKLKYSKPKCLELGGQRSTNRSLAGLRWMHKQMLADGNEKKKKGPMGHAFITTNPLLPKEYFVPTGIEEFVLKMNKGVKHSLLDCPGKYTVQVAHFTGRVTLKQREIEDVKKGAKVKDSLLAEAAEKAHKLTKALRVKGWEAYEFHDRYTSIVTVGSFNSIGTPRPDGVTEINPKVHAIIETFKAKRASTPGSPAGAFLPRVVLGIPCDIQPKPVHVPKRSISVAHNRSPIGLW